MKEFEKAIAARAMQALDLLKRGRADEARIMLENLISILEEPEKRHIRAAKAEYMAL